MTEEKRGLASFFKADVSDLMKGAGKVLRTDIGGLLRSPSAVEPVEAPVLPPDEHTSTKHVSRTTTNSLNNKRPSTETVNSIFAAKRLQTPEEKLAALGDDDDGASQRVRVNTKFISTTRSTQLDDKTLLRNTREAPRGNAAATLLPHQVNEFARDSALPQGDIAHDPAQAAYTSHYGNVQLLIEITWSSGEAHDCLTHLAKQLGDSAAPAPEQQWVLGQLNDSTVFAWCRENYYFRATSAGGGAVLVPFLADFPY